MASICTVYPPSLSENRSRKYLHYQRFRRRELFSSRTEDRVDPPRDPALRGVAFWRAHYVCRK